MKRFIPIFAVMILLAPMIFGGLLEQPPIPYDPTDIGFEYDPSLPSYKIIGAVTIYVGEVFTCEINYFDPDGDKIRVSLLASPGEMSIQASGETEYVPWLDDHFGHDWQIQWTPGGEHVGVNYVNIKIEDAPIGRDCLTDMGTLLLNVVGNNKPPIIGGCTLVNSN